MGAEEATGHGTAGIAASSPYALLGPHHRGVPLSSEEPSYGATPLPPPCMESLKFIFHTRPELRALWLFLLRPGISQGNERILIDRSPEVFISHTELPGKVHPHCERGCSRVHRDVEANNLLLVLTLIVEREKEREKHRFVVPLFCVVMG